MKIFIKNKIAIFIMFFSSINFSMFQYETDPWFLACLKGDVKVVKEMLQKPGFDINLMSDYGTGLSYAALKDKIDVVRLLLERGADPNKYGSWSQATPLIWAINENRPKIVELLLAYGANANISGVPEHTPLQHAVCCRYRPIITALLLHGAEPLPWYDWDDKNKDLFNTYYCYDHIAYNEKRNSLLGKILIFAYDAYRQGSLALLLTMLNGDELSMKSQARSMFKQRCLVRDEQDKIVAVQYHE